MGEEDDSVEQTVADRRERLRALKAAQELLNGPQDDSAARGDDKPDHDGEEDAGEKENMSMKFRNYVPHDKQLQEGKVVPPVLLKFEDPVAAEPPRSEQKDPFVNIAPKKPNWDLRRDFQKLDKLERRTQKAMYKIMEEQERQKQITEEDEVNGARE